ncbi:putative hydrolase [Gemmatimonas aurantiaca T-27]|uniref:Putative hydrolase n=1 Tax=Gemmatimonas aurantiaca (strain DSM 14586 / JCM 11422 / NBRC 100505 / T-27) TaxID=379066 RepID=C1A9R8_GEMAT|nr:putative hydrolase [Gemmatimonas aurantiaca T-27]
MNMFDPRLRMAGLALLLATASTVAKAQNARPAPDQAGVARLTAQYVKREVSIPMRDGTKLFTAIYVPRDSSKAVPILLMRTPYSVAPYGATAYPAQLGPFPDIDKEGWIFVNQDVRGRYMSEGYHQFMTPNRGPNRKTGDVDESTDTYDTIEWILKNVHHHNGRVGTWGNSAPGFFVTAGMIDAHPAHKFAYPSAPMVDWWMGDDRHMNGLFKLSQTYNFMRNFDQPRNGLITQYPAGPASGTTDGYAWHLAMGAFSNYGPGPLQNRVAFWDSITVHADYDAFWQARAIWKHAKNITPAVLLVGGWYDVEDPYGMLRLNQSMQADSRSTKQMFVVGPWSHGGWNRADFPTFGAFTNGSPTGKFFRDSIGMPAFRCLLKDDCGNFQFGGALMFEAGTNQWKRFEAWPPKQARQRTLYLREQGRVAFEAPKSAGAAGIDRYVSDPTKPVPYTMGTTFGFNAQYPTEDQRFASRRPDVLVYRSDVLTEDLTVAGPLSALLHIASTGTDADFVVKVIDQYPNDAAPEFEGGPRLDAYERLVRPGVARARWRKGYTRSVPLVANTADTIRVPLDDVMHTFKKGHRIVVHVQSSWYPAVDRNPQRFVPNIYKAKDSDFQSATMTIYRTAARASHLSLTVMP